MSDNADDVQPGTEDTPAFLAGEETAWDAPALSEPGSEEFDADYRTHRTPFESIVRGHLYVQAALIQYVEAGLDRTEAMDLARMEFGQVVNFAVALGLVEPDDAAGYKRLNHLRNRFAHDIKAEISLQDGIDLYNALGPRFQRETAMAAQKPFGEEHLSELVYRSIKVLYFRLVQARQYLLDVAQEPGGTDNNDDELSGVPVTVLESKPNPDGP